MKLKRFLTGPNTTTPAFLPSVLVLVTLLALVGCAGNKPAVGEFERTPIEVVVKVPYECGQPPPVNVVQMRDVEWIPVEADGIKYFALSADGYQALGLNTSDWIAASAQMREQRDFYRDCIERSQDELRTETEELPPES